MNLDNLVEVELRQLLDTGGHGTRLRYAFINNDIRTMRQLLARTRRELLRIPNLGRATVGLLEATLRERGLLLGYCSDVPSWWDDVLNEQT